jgi:hypothetical protein
MSQIFNPGIFNPMMGVTGLLSAGAQARFYLTGTTTPATVYTTAALNVAHGTTVDSDAAARLPPIFFNPSIAYRCKLYTAAGALIPGCDFDPVNDTLAASLGASGGSALVGFLQSGTGAVAETVQAALRRLPAFPGQFSAAIDGVTLDTTALQNTINSRSALGGGIVQLPPGTFLTGQISLPSNIELRGCGKGVTILKAKASLGVPVLVNSDTVGGNSAIKLHGFTIDGNYLNQTVSTNGLLLSACTGCHIDDIEFKNCAMGFVISTGSRNYFGPGIYAHANGKAEAGYGGYLFCTDDNIIMGGRYDDNCIGLAIEASGVGLHSHRNRVIAPICLSNRADFTQSGAGVHFECSGSATMEGNELIAPVCKGSTGIGIGNTSTELKIIGGYISDNALAGISTAGAPLISYSGITLEGNGLSAAGGYKAEMVFDETALSPATTGIVTNCMMTGSASVNAAILTRSVNTAIKLIDNYMSGYTPEYSLSGTADVIVRSDRGTFTASLTGCTAGVTGTARWSINGDIVTVEYPVLQGTSNTTAATITGAPAAIYPTRAQSVMNVVTDNTVDIAGRFSIATNAVVTLNVGAATAFTGSGTKGVPAGVVIQYRL